METETNYSKNSKIRIGIVFDKRQSSMSPQHTLERFGPRSIFQKIDYELFSISTKEQTSHLFRRIFFKEYEVESNNKKLLTTNQ